MEESEDFPILDSDPFDSLTLKSASQSPVMAMAYVDQHECMQCCCCVGDKPAPFAQWISSHCKASVDSMEPKSPTLESESFFCSDYDHLFVDSSPLLHIFE
ncbi:hypothetical protein DY000_02001397 [Brassica cretica]|uniref:Uncharacterized protein n=1 Tax=Brassica cretica TaxID=69181 RepID=A0ABQ7BZG0_BRACR|nr:hypothetical protein DY000_02001397 [Brassica cretica]